MRAIPKPVEVSKPVTMPEPSRHAARLHNHNRNLRDYDYFDDIMMSDDDDDSNYDDVDDICSIT